MSKLPEIWKEAGRRGLTRPDYAPAQLTDADVDLDVEELDLADPEVPEFIRERIQERRHEKQMVSDFDHRQQEAAKTTKQRDDDQHRRDWLLSEQYRREYQNLCDDITDAKIAAHDAYERALKRKQEAEAALEEARRRALVIQGNRVYFTRDGQRLYAEDGSEITDRDTIAAARSEQARHPDATTYEDQRDKESDQQRAISDADQLRTVIGKLDQLDDRLQKGTLSPDELAQARKEKQRLIDDLPEEARERYERLQAARKNPLNGVTTRTADRKSSETLDLDSHFERAGAAVTAEIEPREEARSTQPGGQPAYRTPDFGS